MQYSVFTDVLVSAQAIGEGNEFVVCAQLYAVTETERNFIVALDTINGTGYNSFYISLLYFIFNWNVTAIADSDYTGVSSNKIFSSGSTTGATKCVNITILNGDWNENFTVTLTTSDPYVLLGTGVIVITIKNG